MKLISVQLTCIIKKPVSLEHMVLSTAGSSRVETLRALNIIISHVQSLHTSDLIVVYLCLYIYIYIVFIVCTFILRFQTTYSVFISSVFLMDIPCKYGAVSWTVVNGRLCLCPGLSVCTMCLMLFLCLCSGLRASIDWCML